MIDETIGGALKQLFPTLNVDIGDRVETGDSGSTPDTSGTSPSDGSTTDTTVPSSDETPAELLQRAEDLFDQADAALAKSPPDYATYGEKQAEARDLIAQALKGLDGS